MRFEPLDNGLDFLEAAVNEFVDTPTESNLKYGTLHLVAAVEVILKAKLSEEHWSLVFKDFGRRKRSEREAYESGDFVSVSATEALRRIRDIVGADVPAEIPGFNQLVRRRNQFMHYGINVQPEEIQANAARVMSFCLSFLDNQFRDEYGEWPIEIEHVVGRIRPQLESINQLVEERLTALGPSLQSAEIVVQCPDCDRPTLVVEQNIRCLFCLQNFDAEDAAERYVEEVLGQSRYSAIKGGGDFALHTCPRCEVDALVEGVEVHYWDVGDDPHSAWTPYWLCFAEAEPFELFYFDRCVRCGNLTDTGAGDSAVCENCYASYVH